MNDYRVSVARMRDATERLTIMEDLAYRRLLDRYYLTEKPLQGCVSSLAEQIGMPGYEREVASVLDAYFIKGKQGEWRDTWADWQIRKNKKAQRS